MSWRKIFSRRNSGSSASVQLLGGLLFIFILSGCRSDSHPIAKAEVWAAIQEPASRYRIDAEFVYALVGAESNFDSSAVRGEGRGLLQLTPAAWRSVSSLPYAQNVNDWRKNLTVGIDYLAWCRHVLQQKKVFSYPLLIAAFHYGLDYVQGKNFEIKSIPVPENVIYRRLFAGDLAPLPPPSEAENSHAIGSWR